MNDTTVSAQGAWQKGLRLRGQCHTEYGNAPATRRVEFSVQRKGARMQRNSQTNLLAFGCEAWFPKHGQLWKETKLLLASRINDVAARYLLLRWVRRRPLTRSQIEDERALPA